MTERKRGRPGRHWADKLRVEMWYQEVKQQSGWSDYRLNAEFAWTEHGKKVVQQSHLSENEIDTTHRPRIFEWLRKTGKKPAGRDPRWRDMEQIVNAVDIAFNGTEHLYCTKLWDFLQVERISPASIKTEVEELLKESSLVRLDHIHSSVLDELVDKYGFTPVFDRCLRLSLRSMSQLSAIELVWYLYLLAEPVDEIRKVIEKIADKKLEKFFAIYYPDTKALQYSQDSIHQLRITRLDLGRMLGQYDALEILARQMILPKELVHSVTEGHLFHNIESLSWSKSVNH